MTTLQVSQAETLLLAAVDAARHAYAPYSNFLVGAALLLADGRVVTGVNVENTSYGLTVCAERVAVFKTISEGYREILALAVAGGRIGQGVLTPCGACRQVLWEFMPPETPIIMGMVEDGLISGLSQKSLGALLPEAFSVKYP